MPVTISDIARIANVSKATVSAVLNNRPGISSQTRDRILTIIQRLNYRPNQVARSLSNRQTKSIGLVIKEIDNPYFSKVMKGVFDTCTDRGYTVLLGSSELSPDKENQCVETFIAQRVDGLILSPLQGDDINFAYLSDLIREKYPLVTLDVVKNYQTNVVEVNNTEGAYQAVSYLISQGHSRIAFFAGPSHSTHSEDRLEGYRRACRDHQIPVRPDMIFQVGSDYLNGYGVGKKIFNSRENSPSAVFCYNDLVAIGLINGLLEMGIEVPGDVSVIGFDNIVFSDSLKIPLTTVDTSTYLIGEKAADLLIKQIADRENPLNEQIVLEPKLIHRNTVKMLNQ